MTRTNEALWEKAKTEAKAKMGGKHSARAMQLAGKLYKDKGGSYTGPKTEAQKSMSKWSKEEWTTKSGKPSSKTGERYLPKKAIEALTPAEYAATTRAKRAGTRQGKQFVAQPKKVAEKAAKYR
jgi:allophanate hydrolase subunit 2